MSNVSLMCVRLTQGCPDNIFDIQLHHRTRGSVENTLSVISKLLCTLTWRPEEKRKTKKISDRKIAFDLI